MSLATRSAATFIISAVFRLVVRRSLTGSGGSGTEPSSVGGMLAVSKK